MCGPEFNFLFREWETWEPFHFALPMCLKPWIRMPVLTQCLDWPHIHWITPEPLEAHLEAKHVWYLWEDQFSASVLTSEAVWGFRLTFVEFLHWNQLQVCRKIRHERKKKVKSDFQLWHTTYETAKTWETNRVIFQNCWCSEESHLWFL